MSPGLMMSWFNDVSVCKEFRMKALGLGRLEQTAQGCSSPISPCLGLRQVLTFLNRQIQDIPQDSCLL